MFVWLCAGVLWDLTLTNLFLVIVRFAIPGSGVKCGLSLLILYSAQRGFLRELQFPLSSKTKIGLGWDNCLFQLQCPQLVLKH